MIAVAAIDSKNTLAVVGVGVLLLAALFAAIYVTSVTVRAFFPRPGTTTGLENVREASPLMTVPMLLLALVTLVFGLCGGMLSQLFAALLFG